MAGQGQLKRNYRARYCNTERQVVDLQPGENMMKYIQDCFETAAREHPGLRPSLSTSSSSSPDLNQDRFLPPSEKVPCRCKGKDMNFQALENTQKKKSPGSFLVNSVRSAFSIAGSQAQPREASSSGGDSFLPNSSDEDEMSLGSPALLVEEQEAPGDPEVAPPGEKGSLFPGSALQAPPPPLPWNAASPELENEGEFVIAEFSGGPSWLLQPQKNNLTKERSSAAPLLESDKAAKEHGIDNVHCGAHIPVAGLVNSFSEQPQSIVPSAPRSPASKQLQKQKCPKTVPLKKQVKRPRKNVKCSARDMRKKLALEKSREREPKELGVRQSETPPGDSLTPLGKRSPHVGQTFLVSPEDECGGALTQEGPCEAEKAFPFMEQQKSRTLSAQCSFVRAINMNDLSGPVCNQNDKASFEHEMVTGGNAGDSVLEPFVALEENSVLLPSDSLKDKVVRPPDNTTCPRRSKRLRLKPLEYWRGERVMYKMEPSGGLVARGIISPKWKGPHKLNRIKQPTEVDLEKMLDNVNAALKDPSQPAHVFDVASKQEVLQECVSSGHSELLFFSNEDVSIYKYFSTPLFSAGKLILKPLKEKGSQYSLTDTLVFHVVKGRLLLILYSHCYSLRAGNYFYVPAGNVYNIRNVLNEECILFFTQIKGNRPEDE